MSFVYDFAVDGFLDGSLDWDTDDIRQILVDIGAYTADQAVDQWLSDIPGGARISVSGTLTGRTVAARAADHAAVTHLAVTGASVEAVVYYKHTGVDGTSRLIAYVDAASAGLPVTPNGSGITVTPDTGPNKVFRF